VYSYQGNPMNTLAAAVLARRTGSQLIVDLQDPWPSQLSLSGSRLGRRIHGLTSRAYGRVIRDALTITPSFRPFGESQGTYVANWSPDESKLDGTGPRLSRLLYAGSFGRAQRLSMWMGTLAQIVSLGIVDAIDMYGTGPEVAAITEVLTPGISLHDPVPVLTLSASIRHAWGLVPVTPGLLAAGFAPQKIAYYMSRGVTPLIAIDAPLPGDLARVPPGCLVVDRTLDSWRNAVQVAGIADPARVREVYDERYSKLAAVKRVSNVILSEGGYHAC
jgi:hypothetical protein